MYILLDILHFSTVYIPCGQIFLNHKKTHYNSFRIQLSVNVFTKRNFYSLCFAQWYHLIFRLLITVPRNKMHSRYITRLTFPYSASARHRGTSTVFFLLKCVILNILIRASLNIMSLPCFFFRHIHFNTVFCFAFSIDIVSFNFLCWMPAGVCILVKGKCDSALSIVCAWAGGFLFKEIPRRSDITQGKEGACGVLKCDVSIVKIDFSYLFVISPRDRYKTSWHRGRCTFRESRFSHFSRESVQAARRHLDAFINLRGNNFEYELQKIEWRTASDKVRLRQCLIVIVMLLGNPSRVHFFSPPLIFNFLLCLKHIKLKIYCYQLTKAVLIFAARDNSIFCVPLAQLYIVYNRQARGAGVESKVHADKLFQSKLPSDGRAPFSEENKKEEINCAHLWQQHISARQQATSFQAAMASQSQVAWKNDHAQWLGVISRYN